MSYRNYLLFGTFAVFEYVCCICRFLSTQQRQHLKADLKARRCSQDVVVQAYFWQLLAYTRIYTLIRGVTVPWTGGWS